MKCKLIDSESTRKMILAACGIACLLIAGCASTGLWTSQSPVGPEVFQGLPPQHQIVDVIEANTLAVKQLNSDVKVVMDGMPSVSGTLLLERPNRMRLKVGLLGMTDSGLDVGSNENEFWIWNKSSVGGSQPAIYFARHDEYRLSPIQQTLQLQPQWIIDALGLLEFDRSQPIEGPYQRASDNYYELRTTVESPQGPMKRITVVHPVYGWVVQQAVYDSNFRIIAWARSSNFKHYAQHNAHLPQHIKLHLIDPSGNDVDLAIHFKNHELNSLYVDPSLTWKMPQPGGIPAINLTNLPPPQQTLPQNSPNAENVGRTSDSRPAGPFGSRESRQPWKLPKLQGFDLR